MKLPVWPLGRTSSIDLKGSASPAGLSAPSPHVWTAASAVFAGAIFGSIAILSAIDADMTAQAQPPTPTIETGQIWAAIAEQRTRAAAAAEQLQDVIESRPIRQAGGPSTMTIGMPSAQAREVSASDDLLPDLGELYVGAEGPSDGITADGNDVRIMTANSGDTIATMLIEAGANPADVKLVLRALAPRFNPKDLRRGQRITVELKPEPPRPLQLEPVPTNDADAEIEEIATDASKIVPRDIMALVIKPSVEKEIAVRRLDGGSFEATETILKLTPRDYRAVGMINTSLYLSAAAAEVPDGVTGEFIRLFSYDVDFQRDVQAGDKFELFYTRYFDEFGDPVKDGEILYASLDLSGQTRQLYRYVSREDGSVDYYDANGASARKFLLRTPVDGARMSSGFGMRRHPILGYSKMHRGIDFAAPTGTPIMAAGQGTIEFLGRKGSYGNYIRIRHNGEYQTAYAHLSKFGQGIRVGSKVRQGQIIGFVGTTGRSTGPHLHYEILKDGDQVDPTRVKITGNQRLQGRDLAEFLKEKARIDGLMTSSPLNGPVSSLGATPSPDRSAE